MVDQENIKYKPYIHAHLKPSTLLVERWNQSKSVHKALKITKISVGDILTIYRIGERSHDISET